ncbi:MAG: hypothetical protein RL235_786 [Chlamydiota bacterium]|jgi:oxygen-independent coproporphyrinogen-3 oxidase
MLNWNVNVPRYTSYPTAPQFYPVDEGIYQRHLEAVAESPISLYIHIPFCKTMCLFCGCSVVLNRDPLKQERYLNALLREIDQLPMSKNHVVQLHLGGGTPTSLTEMQMEALLTTLQTKFHIDGEVSIEIDPRTVFFDGGKKLAHLKECGFNRVSFGVQDLDPKVQEAVKRRQSEEMTQVTYELARSLGFHGINLDLIYGLPHQTRASFQRTIEAIARLRPDRISLFSYAKVPWLKPHQKAIDDAWLPSVEEKFAIYKEARLYLIDQGYVAIGMDHFALQNDPLVEALHNKTLTRNFQGYTTCPASHLVGLGVTSIGYVSGAYFQNHKEIALYETTLQDNRLPVAKGFVLAQDDLIRRGVIEEIMCHFGVDKVAFEAAHGAPFDIYFSAVQSKLAQLETEGLIEQDAERLKVTAEGQWLLRIIASSFDAYLGKGHYSKAI